MRVTQISVFLENRPGRLANLLQVLAQAKVNLRALSLADTADFGIARIIVADTAAAMEAIRRAGLTAATTEVLRVEVPDVPGGLENTIVVPLAEAGVNIEYLYAHSGRPSERAEVVLKVDRLEKAEQVLKDRLANGA
ncbi:MAG: ACT domain-containing protein [Chloroflexi bacterium]|nr:ACT domain-containing protein [Chloroflexota bacterium]